MAVPNGTLTAVARWASAGGGGDDDLPIPDDAIWVATTGNDTTGDGSEGNPYLTLSKAFDEMASGDTVVMKAGTYVGASNAITNSNRPVSGSAGAYSVVRAETPGAVVLDGEEARSMLSGYTQWESPSASYLHFHGLQFVRPQVRDTYNVHSITGAAADNRTVDHLKVTRCGFQHNFYVSRASYVLVEDCYCTGRGRYNFMAQTCDHVVKRRCVARLDAADGYATGGVANPVSHFMNYDSQGLEWQNCICIDSDDDYYVTDPGFNGTWGGFYVRTGPYGIYYSPDTINRGCLSLNVKHDHFGYGSDLAAGSATGFAYGATGREIHDSVFWDGGRGSQNDGSLDGLSDALVNHCVFGSLACDNAVYSNYGVSGKSGASGRTGTVKNSIFYNITNALAGTAGGVRYVKNALNNCFYGCAITTNNVDTETGSVTAVDPTAASLLYLPRIEDGSALATVGDDGGRVGPRIVNRIGAAGAMWGETDWNAETTTALWPFPHQDEIRAFFRTYGQATPDPERGFCADGESLTHYIWNYLGNGSPY